MSTNKAGVKNEIKVGDTAVFLYEYDLLLVTVLKVNPKSIKIHYNTPSGLIEFTKNVPHHKVAHIDDVYSVVWTTDKGPRGSYRFEYDMYPHHNDNFSSKWKSARSWNYVWEEDGKEKNRNFV